VSLANAIFDVRILPLREEDIPDLLQLARDIWYAHYPSIITVEQIEYMLEQRYRPEIIRNQLASGTAWWDTLLLDGNMVAFTSYELSEHADAMKLDKLYVRYDLRGRGYGSLLMRHVEEKARARGRTRLYLQVNKNNASAIDAYRRNGFAVTAAARFDIGRGFIMDDYVMSKALLAA
jgi:ribosomal protein S18 acetylase RimI-like enzyme